MDYPKQGFSLSTIAGQDLIGFRDEAVELLLIPHEIRACRRPKGRLRQLWESAPAV
jgi:hypothetical protein